MTPPKLGFCGKILRVLLRLYARRLDHLGVFFHVAHHYCFSPRTLHRLAQKTGFAVKRVDSLDGGEHEFFSKALVQCHAAQPHLDGRYTIAGEIDDRSGSLEVLDALMPGDEITAARVE